MTRDVLVGLDALREQVRGKYREVAVDPGASFHWLRGGCAQGDRVSGPTGSTDDS